MTESNDSSTEARGRLDDAQEEGQQSSTTGGPAAEGEYDPAQGSPGHPHPTGPGIAADPEDIGVSDD
ncbi:MAG: hypothetical protein ACTHJH_07970 [Marmoricola sp.]